MQPAYFFYVLQQAQAHCIGWNAPQGLDLNAAGFTEEALGRYIDQILLANPEVPVAQQLHLIAALAPRQPQRDNITWFADTAYRALKRLCPDGITDALRADPTLRYLKATQLFMYRHQCDLHGIDFEDGGQQLIIEFNCEAESVCGQPVNLAGTDWTDRVGTALFGPAWAALYLEPGMTLEDYYQVIWLDRPPFADQPPCVFSAVTLPATLAP